VGYRLGGPVSLKVLISHYPLLALKVFSIRFLMVDRNGLYSVAHTPFNSDKDVLTV